MIEALTAAGVLVAAIYAWLTYRILLANQSVVAAMQRQVKIMEDQSRSLTRPYVTIGAAPERGSILILLRIANDGRSPAQKLRLRVDRPFHQFGDKREERDLSRLNAFSREIEMLAPSAQLVFHLGTSIQIFGGNTPGPMPHVFSIDASYSDSQGNAYAETTTVDLSALYQSAVVRDRVAEKLDELVTAIKALGKTR